MGPYLQICDLQSALLVKDSYGSRKVGEIVKHWSIAETRKFSVAAGSSGRPYVELPHHLQAAPIHTLPHLMRLLFDCQVSFVDGVDVD